MRINVTGMQGNRLVIRAALPAMVENLPHNWSLEDVDSAIETLKSGRSNKAKRAALELLETLRNREMCGHCLWTGNIESEAR
jgi:spermidine/putrescine-binding protein